MFLPACGFGVCQVGWQSERGGCSYPVVVGRAPDVESLGRRVADHRAKLGWTQADLAERLGISRVAVSHVEADMSHPGERTVALLAGLFKLDPHELVDGTTYPSAKADRLPLVANRYTEAELQVALCEADLRWIARDGSSMYGDQVLAQWHVTLRRLARDADRHDRRLIDDCHQKVRHALDERAGGSVSASREAAEAPAGAASSDGRDRRSRSS
jgi:transcriptional regulator with XRE-family HTH domain